MSSRASLLVLKVGGSVLSDRRALPSAVREVESRLESFERVIVVVSAFKNQTDVLEACARELCAEPAPDALAFLLGIGEMRSTAELALALQGAGIAATFRMPWDVWFLSGGPPLEATPVALSHHRFLEAFRDHRVVVFPGFLGRGRDGRSNLLGRGGSDLTAIFLAAEFRADRCILLKDAPGIFEWDPASAGPQPRRYTRMSWDDAMALGAQVLKSTHAEYARARGVTVEVTSPGSASSTVVGPGASEFEDGAASRGGAA
jgi:homoserine dehydrogenase